MINVGIIGAGNIVKNFHLPAWKKINGIKIVGIVDKKIKNAKLLAQKHKINAFYKNINSLFVNQKVDVVDICTPNNQHEKNIIFSLKNKKHVICEKPFVLNFRAFKKISHLAKKNKLVCVCAQHQRFRKPSEISKKLIIQNKLGSVYSAHISAIFKRSKTVSNLNFTSLSKAGGGPIIDLGSHFVDLAWWIMGNPNPISVYTYSSNKLSKYLKINENVPWKKFNVEDYVFGVVKCEKGKSITFQMSYLLNTDRDKKKVEFFGTKGSLSWPNLKVTTIKKNTVNNKYFSSHEKNRASVMELKNFINCIQKKTKQNPTLKEMGFMVKIIEAFRKSIREKKEIIL